MDIQTIVSGKLDNNTYIISNDYNECILIDGACELEEILKYTSNKNVLALFLTHGHFDHFVNMDKIVNKFKIKVYLHSCEVEKLYNPKANYSIVFNKIFSSKLKDENLEVIAENFYHTTIGHFDVKTYLTKGHTNGCICVLIDDKYLFTGDTLFASSCGRTDLITSEPTEIRNSLKLLKENFSGFTFYPGHGPTGVVKSKNK